nr:uncharacterized protein LOC123289165 [Equus asinus]
MSLVQGHRTLQVLGTQHATSKRPSLPSGGLGGAWWETQLHNQETATPGDEDFRGRWKVERQLPHQGCGRQVQWRVSNGAEDQTLGPKDDIDWKGPLGLQSNSIRDTWRREVGPSLKFPSSAEDVVSWTSLWEQYPKGIYQWRGGSAPPSSHLPAFSPAVSPISNTFYWFGELQYVCRAQDAVLPEESILSPARVNPTPLILQPCTLWSSWPHAESYCQDCVYMRKAGSWSSDACCVHRCYSWICEKPRVC